MPKAPTQEDSASSVVDKILGRNAEESTAPKDERDDELEDEEEETPSGESDAEDESEEDEEDSHEEGSNQPRESKSAAPAASEDLDRRLQRFLDVMQTQPPGVQPQASGQFEPPPAPGAPGSAFKRLTKEQLDEIRSQNGDAIADSIAGMQAMADQFQHVQQHLQATEIRRQQAAAAQAQRDISGFFSKDSQRYGTLQQPTAEGHQLYRIAEMFQRQAGGPDLCSNQEALETAAAVLDAQKRNNSAGTARDDVRRSIEKRHRQTDLPTARPRRTSNPAESAEAEVDKFVKKGRKR